MQVMRNLKPSIEILLRELRPLRTNSQFAGKVESI